MEEREPLLALRAARAPLAFRLTEIAGLFANRTVVRLPSHVREFMGILVLRREVVPVYSLPALLGLTTTVDAPRWLVLARGARVAFAFEEFEAYLRVPASAILRTEGEDVRKHAPAAVQHGDGKRSVVSVPALIAAIEERLGGGPP
jgi:chemotaxis signal transduction protein